MSHHLLQDFDPSIAKLIKLIEQLSNFHQDSWHLIIMAMHVSEGPYVPWFLDKLTCPLLFVWLKNLNT